MHVYFIREKTENFVKIGYGCDPWKRLKSLQTGNPRDLELIAYVPAIGYFTETKVHTHFHKFWRHGEWFEISGELLTFINGNLGWYWENRLTVLESTSIESEWIERSKNDLFRAFAADPISVQDFALKFRKQVNKKTSTNASAEATDGAHPLH